MFVKETQNHDFSLQCRDYDEVNQLLDLLSNSDSESLKRLSVKLHDRVSDKYASGDTKYTVLVFHNEVPTLLSHGLNVLLSLENKPKLLKRVLGVKP